MPHKSRQRPSRKSRIASSARASRRPAATSSSNCLSHATASNSENQLANAKSSWRRACSLRFRFHVRCSCLNDKTNSSFWASAGDRGRGSASYAPSQRFLPAPPQLRLVRRLRACTEKDADTAAREIYVMPELSRFYSHHRFGCSSSLRSVIESRIFTPTTASTLPCFPFRRSRSSTSCSPQRQQRLSRGVGRASPGLKLLADWRLLGHPP